MVEAASPRKPRKPPQGPARPRKKHTSPSSLGRKPSPPTTFLAWDQTPHQAGRHCRILRTYIMRTIGGWANATNKEQATDAHKVRECTSAPTSPARDCANRPQSRRQIAQDRPCSMSCPPARPPAAPQTCDPSRSIPHSPLFAITCTKRPPSCPPTPSTPPSTPFDRYPARLSAHLVLDLHLVEDGGPVVRDGHVAVGAHQHLVHPLRPQGRPEDVAHASRREDVCLRFWRRGGRREEEERRGGGKGW